MRARMLAGWIAGLGTLAACAPLAAQEAGRRAAITDSAHAGPDFLLQGEYAGWVYVPGRGSEHVGLQIIALGEGKFDAVRYRGGLPGTGWDGVTKTKLSGQLADGSLTLSGPLQLFVLWNGAAVAVDANGRELGRLARVQRRSPTLGLLPPPRASILFDGSSTEHLQGAKVTPDGLLLAGVLTKMPVEAFHLHLEFRTPYMPAARGQGRGNSGVYIQQRYEVQILDSFGLEGIENECGALYRQRRPDLNVCLPPLAWQTYDIWFTPPRFSPDGQTKLTNARITVLHNGYPIHWRREITAKTGGGKAEGPEPLPINLQDHGNPVAFRNIWIVPGEGDSYQQVVSAPASYRRHCCKRRPLRLFCRRCR
jgi:hypothetical protein